MNSGPLVVLAAVLVVLIGAPSAFAQGRAVACPAFKPPSIELDTQQAPVSHDFGKPLAALERLQGNRRTIHGGKGSHVLGLAHARLVSRVQFTVSIARLPDGTFCAAPATVRASFGFSESRVLVARELPRGSCIHGEVLAHEMRHVEVDRALLQEYTPKIRAALEETIERIGSVRDRNEKAILAMIKNRIESGMKASFRQFEAAREQRQEQVDTPAEYDRVSRSCGGELGRVLRGGRAAVF